MALDDRYANKFAPLDSMAIYPKPGHALLYTPKTGEMKCPTSYTFALCIPFHLLQCWCNACTNTINNDMIHFISSRDHIGLSILLFTIASVHRCQVITQLALHTCNRSVEPSLVLIFSTLVTWFNVMSHMQWAPSSHVWASQHLWAIFISMAYVAHTHIHVD